MKKTLLALALTCMATAAFADDLGDAKKLFDKQDFKGALTAYTKLADAGNTEAQVLLAEMYWYGEAGKIDLANAEKWFRAAAAKGDPKAQGALKAMAARVARLPEIEKYSKNFTATDLAYENAKCARPAFPDASKTKREIRDVDAAYKQWADCHGAYVTRLNNAMPVEKGIPKDLADLMTEDDLNAAKAKMGQVYKDLAAQADMISNEVVAAQKKWQTDTVAYLEKAEAERQLNLRKHQAESDMAVRGIGVGTSIADSSGFIPKK